MSADYFVAESAEFDRPVPAGWYLATDGGDGRPAWVGAIGPFPTREGAQKALISGDWIGAEGYQA